MPMRLTPQQRIELLRLAHPLHRHQRAEFLRRVEEEVALLGVSEIGDGPLYRIGVGVQRSLLDPPLLDGVTE
jgi:hypothetical protein